MGKLDLLVFGQRLTGSRLLGGRSFTLFGFPCHFPDIRGKSGPQAVWVPSESRPLDLTLTFHCTTFL